MAKVYDDISPKLAAWIEAQPMFFVATAPLAADGLVNVSPKGTTGTFRVLDRLTFSYIDLTGSGVETLAHLRENGRICVMFCAFDGPPTVVRLHGTGRVVINGEPGFDAALEPFGQAGSSRRVQTRSVVTVDVARVADSCGFAVPMMDLRAERDLLDTWAVGKTPEMLDAYHAKKNATSLDGLPGVPADVRTAAVQD
ncbi:pyridoxamine 5'-phosphate oxidase family protein [Pseudonocardia acidicola]|uniref:Pyridoxamine 5'-phosphate oxidase family protein n=1 Tax=Pseudonocardia acidicola TaxID=2724939 RepID=A0ABX1S6U4_9PSEU|nr:pyridoxamine 5'-phosphate oxidase family protein [Pseudonocardia acidicola]NMH96091.1 pyridoxamine 5'-phosphate oxidase family protein [Pseudonocardia acidicola]